MATPSEYRSARRMATVLALTGFRAAELGAVLLRRLCLWVPNPEWYRPINLEFVSSRPRLEKGGDDGGEEQKVLLTSFDLRDQPAKLTYRYPWRDWKNPLSNAQFAQRAISLGNNFVVAQVRELLDLGRRNPAGTYSHDQQPFFSTAHKQPAGDTFSNLFEPDVADLSKITMDEWAAVIHEARSLMIANGGIIEAATSADELDKRLVIICHGSKTFATLSSLRKKDRLASGEDNDLKGSFEVFLDHETVAAANQEWVEIYYTGSGEAALEIRVARGAPAGGTPGTGLQVVANEGRPFVFTFTDRPKQVSIPIEDIDRDEFRMRIQRHMQITTGYPQVALQVRPQQIAGLVGRLGRASVSRSTIAPEMGRKGAAKPKEAAKSKGDETPKGE